MNKLISGILAILLAVALVPSTSSARYLNPNTGRFQTMDTYEGNQSAPLSLHKYVYAHTDPVNRIDPSGKSALGDVVLTMQIKAFLFLTGGSAVAKGLTVGLASLTFAAAIHDPGAFVSAFESPSVAANIAAADVAFLASYGKRGFQFVSGYIAAKTDVAPAVNQMLSASAERIRKIDPKAVVGFRGSTARGYKGPHKENAPFDPEDFDVDAFVVSDRMAVKIGIDKSFRAASVNDFPELVQEQQAIESILRAQFKGLKSEPFTFRVYTSKEFLKKVTNDSHVLTGGGQVLE